MKVERMVKKGLVILAAVVLTASSANAANVETMGIGSMNTAQAGAVAAYADNVFAAYYNPAGLTLIEKPTLTVSTMFYDAQIKVYDWEVRGVDQSDNPNVNAGPMDFESDKMFIASPSMGFAMPITEKVSLGVAAYTPYGMTVTWDKDPSENPGAAYAWESTYGRVAVTPTLAYKVSDKLSFGVGVSMGRSVSDAGKTADYSDNFNAIANAYAIAEADGRDYLVPTDIENGTAAAVGNSYGYLGAGATLDDAKALAAQATLLDGSQVVMETTDDFNYSFNVGVMYRPIEQLSFGLTYRGRTDAKFEGDLTIKDANVLDPATGAPIKMDLGGTVEMDYDHPEQVQAGVRWFANDKLSVEADVTWTGWSVNDEQVENAVIKNVPTPVPGGGIVEMDQEVSFKHARDWEDTTAYRLGVSYQATEAFVFRAGYAYDPSPVPDETFDMGWPDTDRNLYSLGMGWKINERWMLDAVLQHIVSTSKRATTGGSHEMNHNYGNVYGKDAEVYMKDEGILWGAGMTVTYTF